jgi:hypothetical protein
MWLPDDEDISAAALTAIGCTIDTHVRCVAMQLGDIFEQPSSGRRAATFRVRYTSVAESGGVSNEQAKRVHDEMYALMADSFPGAECR